ncbi:hypothetical protein JCM3766R1_002706 [Sporobolomyces carnicolor]
MLVVVAESHTSPILALAPHVWLALNLVGSACHIGFIHSRATKQPARRDRQTAADAEEQRALLRSRAADERVEEDIGSVRGVPEGPTGYEMLLEGAHVLTVVALVAVCVTRLQAGEDKWRRIFDGGILATALYLALLSLLRLVNERFHRVARVQQLGLGAGLAIFAFFSELFPFVFVEHPPTSVSVKLGWVQAALTLALGTILLLSPKRFESRIPGLAPNPAQTASLLSRLLFSFLEPRMARYFIETSNGLGRLFSIVSRQSQSGDPVDFKHFVPELPDILHSRVVLGQFRWKGSERLDATATVRSSRDQNCDEKKHEPAIGTTWCFLWRYRRVVLEILIFASAWIVFVFLSPLSMNLLLRYVQSSQAPPLGLSPYLFAVGIFVAPVATSVCYQSALYRLAQLGLRLRAILGAAVFDKLMRVKAGGGGSKEDDEAKGKQAGGGGGGAEAVGRVNNLVGTDVDVITSSLTPALELFGIVPKLLVSLIFLYFLLGWSAFVALGVIVGFAPVSSVVSKKYGGVQEEIMKATDKRVTLVQELLNSIRILKMFAWEKPSIDRISQTRDLELEKIKKRAKIYSGMMFLSTGIPASVTLATFGAFVFIQKETLTASTAFTAMSLFSLLREAVISATRLLSAFMRASVSVGRIDSFIRDTEQLDDQPLTFTEDADSKTAIHISNAEFRFSRYGSSGFNLKIEDLRFSKNSITIVAGDVGSGKSAVLLGLLGELSLRKGQVEVAKESGSKLKVSYAAQSPWLQDTSIRNNILFGEDFDEERYNDTVFACALENDIEGLPEGDETRCGEKGLSLSGGQKQRICLARAVYSRSQLVLLDDVLSALDSGAVSHVVEHCLNGPLLRDRTVVLVTHFVKLCARRLDNCSLVVNLHSGRVKDASPPSHDLSAGGSGMLRSNSGSSLRSNRSTRSKSSQGKQEHHVKHGSPNGHREDGDESGAGTQISWRVYRTYFAAMGGWTFWALYILVNLTAHVFMLAQGWWIGKWVEAPARDSQASKYFSIYAAIQIISASSLTAMYLALIAGGIRASRILYTDLTNSMFSAPFRWWDRTPLGNALNRHTKDTEIADTEQVDNLQPVFDYSVQVLFVAIVICSILPIFLLPAAAIALVFFLIGKLYVRNALAARKEIASARSPLFSTLGDATSGIVTIRAFGREEYFVSRYKTQTDRYNQVQLYGEGLDRWLEERSDMVGALVSFIVGLLCLSSGLSSGVTGFLISTGLEFTSRILYVVRSVNRNELSMNSVQRIVQYSTEIPWEEADSEKKQPPASWPHDGAIEFDKFSAKYSEGSQDVLHELSFSIKPGEKIGIVGESGCGKSSLSLALMRFIITSEGAITIDGRKLSETNIEALRSRLTLVPQDPTLFSGTLRSNLDPTDDHDDEALWSALKRSGFAKENDNLDLDSEIRSGGSNLSQGQRQLVGLARALVRRSKVVILDEATASLDNESDRLVQRAIREEFEGCTLLTVAHRIETIVDYDRILVLAAGSVVEFDEPHTLLEKQDGAFRAMCESTGNFDDLFEKAKKGRE